MTQTEVRKFILGEIIRQRRAALGISQTTMAERIGTTQTIMSRIECGHCSPDIFVARMLEEHLNLSWKEFHELMDMVIERATNMTLAVLQSATRETWVTDAVRLVGVSGFVDGIIRFSVAAVLVDNTSARQGR